MRHRPHPRDGQSRQVSPGVSTRRKAARCQSPPVQLDINPGQTKYDFEDVQLGNYNIILLAKPVLTKGPDGELDVSIPSLAEKRVQVKKGETAEVQF